MQSYPIPTIFFHSQIETFAVKFIEYPEALFNIFPNNKALFCRMQICHAIYRCCTFEEI